MFNDSIRFSLELQDRIIVDFVAQLSRENPPCQITLVGQRILNKIRVLDETEFSLEALHVVEIIDTCCPDIDILRSRGSLGTLLITIRSPF